MIKKTALLSVCLCLVAACLFAEVSSGNTPVAYIQIEETGFWFVGNISPSSTCGKKNVYWVSTESGHPNSKEIYSALLAAMISNNEVAVVSDTCFTIPYASYNANVIKRLRILPTTE